MEKMYGRKKQKTSPYKWANERLNKGVIVHLYITGNVNVGPSQNGLSDTDSDIIL